MIMFKKLVRVNFINVWYSRINFIRSLNVYTLMHLVRDSFACYSYLFLNRRIDYKT